MSQTKMNLRQTIRAVVLGHAVGDALGVPVEFCDRKELDENPVTDMMGFGTYPYPAGSWSDDTAMSLAALDSLAQGAVDFKDIMERFARWLEKDEYTPTGETFDVGRTCLHAVIRYLESQCPPTEAGGDNELSNGNGSLMRIHPFVLYAYAKGFDTREQIALVESASALTHRHPRSKMGCGIYSFILTKLLESPTIESGIEALRTAQQYYADHEEAALYARLFSPDFRNLSRDAINSSGYVVSTLEAAIWCLLNTESYRDCVLAAVNLGDDADTVAAVAGGLAGALYGLDGIPAPWLETLARRDYIEAMCDRAATTW